MPLQTLPLERGPRLSPGRLPGASVRPSWCFVIWRGHHRPLRSPDCIQNDYSPAITLTPPKPQHCGCWIAWFPLRETVQWTTVGTAAPAVVQCPGQCGCVWQLPPEAGGPRLKVVAASTLAPSWPDPLLRSMSRRATGRDSVVKTLPCGRSRESEALLSACPGLLPLQLKAALLK